MNSPRSVSQMIELVPTSKPSVYRVEGAPADWSVELLESGIERFVAREFPCPMKTHGATAYRAHVRRGLRDRGAFYVLITLT